jgi:hypothetical protein
MEAPADIPPIIEVTPRRTFAPVTFFGLVALAMFVALATGYFDVALPRCTFKTLTGLPCAFCGGTRALRALGHLHFTEAFWFNPLVTVGVFGAAISAIAGTLAPRSFERCVWRVKRLPLLWIGLAVVAANWIFVLKFLPR